MPPQVNARLTRVQATNAGESFDGGETAGTDKWAGDVGAYYYERRDRQRSAEGEERVNRGILIVDHGAPPIDWASGDWATYTHDDAPPTTRKVKLVETDVLEDMPADLQSVTLEFEQ